MESGGRASPPGGKGLNLCSPVGLVQDEDLNVAQLEAGSVVQVVDEATRGGNQNVWPRPKRRFLGFEVQPTCKGWSQSGVRKGGGSGSKRKWKGAGGASYRRLGRW